MSTRSNKRDRARREIERAWGDVPVVDAKGDLRVMITPEDLDGAIAEDPALCVFARACMRSFDSSKVLFFREVAYVELPDELGEPRVERFIMGQSMRDVIAAFDRGDPIIPRAGFTLRAPSGSNTLAGKRRENHKAAARERSRERERRRRERMRAEASARAESEGGDAPPEPGTPGGGTNPPRSKFAPFREDPLLVDVRARSGSGVVNWFRKRASRARRAAASPGGQSQRK